MSALAHADHGIERHGFCICPAVLSVAECAAIIEELGPVARAGRRGVTLAPRNCADSSFAKVDGTDASLGAEST